MRVVIVGAGRAGCLLAKMLADGGHDVIVVDKSRSVIEEITDRLSVNGVCGSGASREVLLAAGADTADVLVSMTPVDETNLLVCSMAKNSGARYVAASLDRDELTCDEAYLRERFHIDYILTPKKLVAQEIAEQIFFNAANKVESLFDSRILMTEITVGKDSQLIDSTLNDLKPRLEVDFLVFAVNRGGRLLVPHGGFVLQKGDVIGLVAAEQEMVRLFAKIGLSRKPVKHALLVGGGDVGELLARALIAHGVRVKLVESDRAHCQELMEKLPGAKIVYGSGVDVELMEEEQIQKADACVCLTGQDETNLLASLVAWSGGVDNIITKIETDSYEKVLRQVTINITVSPDRTIAGKLMEFIQNIRKQDPAEESRYYSLGTGMIRAKSFHIPEGFEKAGIPLMSNRIKLKKGMIAAAIIRNGRHIIPKGADSFQSGDRVIIILENGQKADVLSDVLE